jgi:hypothetical protein
MPFDLSNRELASATIILGMAAWGLYSNSVRSSMFEVVKGALQWKISVTVLATWLVIGAGIAVLKEAGLWSNALLKDAAIWAVFSGIAIAFRGVSEAEPNAKFKSLATDQIKGVVVFEFLVNVHSMSYPFELAWLLLMMMVTLLIAVGGRDESKRRAVSLLNVVQGLLGLWMLSFIVYSLWQKPSEIFALETLRSFLLPIFLALWVLPFGYVVSLVAGYEALFIRLKIGRRQPLDLRLYSQFKLIEFGGLNSSRVRRMGKLLGPRTSWPKDHDEVDQLFLALGRTMQDPLLDEAGDFGWPPVQSWNEGPTIASMVEYRRQIDPLITKLVELENAALELMGLHLTDEKSKPLFVNGLKARFVEMEDTVETAVSLPNLAPRLRKLDRRFQDYAASVDNFYRMAIRPDGKSWESWRATVELFSELCREAREKMENAIIQFGSFDAK